MKFLRQILQMDVGDENNISDDKNNGYDSDTGNIENHLQMHVDYYTTN